MPFFGGPGYYICSVSETLLLDIGSEKILIAELQGKTVLPPERIQIDNRHILLLLQEALADRSFDLVAAAATGMVSGGRLYSKRLGNIDLEDFFRQRFDAELLLINDGHAAARAAAWHGYNTPLLAAHLGTGMALGIYGEDELYRGAYGFAGARDRPQGGFLLASLYTERSGSSKNPQDIFLEQSPLAEEIIEEVAQTVAEDIIRFAAFLDPATLVLSGGALLDSLSPRLLGMIKEKSGEELWQQLMLQAPVEVSPHGTFAPLIGAATLLTSDPDIKDLF